MNELKTQTEKALVKIAKSKKAVKDLPKTGDYLFFKIKKEIAKIVSELFNNKVIKTSDLNISLPPYHIKADLSLEIFSISKILGLDPKKVSKELGLVINKNKTKFIESATTAGPYLNLKLKKNVYGEALAEVTVLEEKYGKNDKNKNKLAIIDFSSPNIAKPMSVGHLRSTVLGQALANIYEATGYVVVRDNHIGDWGTQFGKLIYAYQTWGDEKAVAKNPIAELNKLYIKFNEEANKDPELDDKAREIFSNLEKGDGKIRKLWEKFSKLSIKEFEEVYDILGIKFDTYLGESYFAKDAEDEVKKALEKNLARKDEESDAIVVDTLLGVPSFLLRKQDGSTLYISRDLAKIKFRIANFI
ncbi:MAG: Arginine-tRNA ligase [Parcubacteria group bacterium GW2011_GWB2_40_8]|nr:MAG: Arginine-tRNA ligase [Parcubacteria group bacterium GW2011_GWB2_40_8]